MKINNKKQYIAKSLFQFIWSRQFKELSILFIIYFFFEKKINEFLNTTVIFPFLSYFEISERSNYLMLLISMIVIYYLFEYLKKNYKLAYILNLFISFTGIIILYNRVFNKDGWYFYPIYGFSKIYYCDIFILLFLLNIIINFKNFIHFTYKGYLKITNPELIKNKSSFIIDLPWKRNDDDIIIRKPAAKRLSDEIIKMQTEESFAIGIIGEWGSGKSSFIEMIKENLEKESDINIVEFNPWKSSTTNLIVKDFFGVLKSKLSPYNDQLAGKIEFYAKKLANNDKTFLGKLYQDLFIKDEGTKYQFDEINGIIKGLNQKTIVIIDDIDRLHRKEVIEILKLIRNTAKFYNTIFIAAYDKDYVIDAVSSINEHRKEFYLEKIFQIEITLPAQRETLVKEKLSETLSLKYPLREKEIRESIIIGENKIISSVGNPQSDIPKKKFFAKKYLEEFITNLRDLKRLTSSFIYNYSQIQEEIEFEDYLSIEILKLKCLPIYEALRKKQIIALVNTEKDGIKKLVYTLNEVTFNKEFFNGKISNVSKDIILGLLKEMFAPNYINSRSIQIPSMFSLYFSDQLFNNIPLKELKISRKNGFIELKKFIDNSLVKKLKSELLEAFYEIDAFDDKDDFECIMQSKLYLISKNIGYRSDNFFNQISGDFLQQILKNFYSSKKEELVTSIKMWFKNIQSNSISSVLSNYIKEFSYSPEYEFILTKKELQEIVLNNLQSHILSSNELSETTFLYYYQCIESIDKKTNLISLMKKANQIFRKHIEKFSESYLKIIIRPFPSGDNVFILEPYYIETFGSNANFETFLKNLPNSKIVDEVKIFYEMFKKNNYRAIHFVKEDINKYKEIFETQIDTIKFQDIPKNILNNKDETIDSSFLKSQEGTFSAWVKLKPVIEYYSKPMNFEYLISHSTNYNSLKVGGIHKYPNVFSISIEPNITHTSGKSPTSINWRLWISNSKGENFNLKGLELKNNNYEWMHLLVRWNHEKKVIEIFINGVIVNKSNTYFKFWPTEFLDKAIIGTWGNKSKLHDLNLPLYRIITSSQYVGDSWIQYEQSYKPTDF